MENGFCFLRSVDLSSAQQRTQVPAPTRATEKDRETKPTRRIAVLTLGRQTNRANTFERHRETNTVNRRVRFSPEKNNARVDHNARTRACTALLQVAHHVTREGPTTPVGAKSCVQDGVFFCCFNQASISHTNARSISSMPSSSGIANGGENDEWWTPRAHTLMFFPPPNKPKYGYQRRVQLAEFRLVGSMTTNRNSASCVGRVILAYGDRCFRHCATLYGNINNI